MNNEYNNNQSGENSINNVDPNNFSTDNDMVNKEQEYTSTNEVNNPYLFNSSYQTNEPVYQNNASTSYPVPELVEKKPKMKHRVLGALLFGGAAVAFGLIAGITFHGYYRIANLSDREAEKLDIESKLQLTEITQDTDETIVTTGTSTDTIVTDVSDVVANVVPSIVAINASATVAGYDFFGREYLQPSEGSGSGIIIGQNGTELLIVTNNHVIEGAETVEIVFVDETTAKAIVKGADSNTDLAVLSVDMNELSTESASAIKVATLGNSDEVQAGDLAIAIGNALGYGQSVTGGYISAVNREVTIDEQTMTLIQTDAAINPGNSGGALLNSVGQVIGINSVKYASEAVEGMGYAIPISSAIPMINELMNREVVAEEEKGYLGIDATTAQNVTQIYAERFNMPIGVYVNDVIEGSPAEAAGLMQGDIITGLDNTAIETIDDLVSVLSYKKAGQTVELKVQVKENGAYVEKILSVTLGSRG